MLVDNIIGKTIGFGGQGGIRTHGTLAGTPHFECGAIDHSTTCPPAVIKKPGGQGKPFFVFRKRADSRGR